MQWSIGIDRRDPFRQRIALETLLPFTMHPVALPAASSANDFWLSRRGTDGVCSFGLHGQTARSVRRLDVRRQPRRFGRNSGGNLRSYIYQHLIISTLMFPSFHSLHCVFYVRKKFLNLRNFDDNLWASDCLLPI